MSAIDYSSIPNSTVMPNGKTAWRALDLPSAMKCVIENDWIVLGGDVLTLSGEFTYDNWYYEPNELLDLTQNVQRSVAVCLEYASKYTIRNGNQFLFSLVLSNSYLTGQTPFLS